MSIYYLVDGTALAYRSHFAFIKNPLRTSKGEETSAIFGYVNTLRMILREEQPDLIAVAFDVSRETFRSEMYKEYKATRAKAPEELKAQFAPIKELTIALGIPVLEKQGFEADDIIGTAALQAAQAGHEVRIVSGDKDMLQLVDETIKVLDIGKRGGPVTIDEDGVVEKFGVAPDKIVEMFALMGDASDNVPGVPLVGPKKAAALIREFGSLEAVLAAAPQAKKSKTNDNLVEFADQARLSRDLVVIKTDVAIETPLTPYDAEARDNDRLAEMYERFEFRDLLKEVATAGAKPASNEGYQKLTDGDALAALVKDLRGRGSFVFGVKTDDRLLGVALCWAEGDAAYVPWTDASRKLLQPLLEDDKVTKGGQDLKHLSHVLSAEGIAVRGLRFDTMLASYVLDPGRATHTLDAMALHWLGIRMTPAEELVGKGKDRRSLADIDIEKVARFAAEDADCAFRLVEHFRPLLKERELEKLFFEVEMPLVPVLAAMEDAGIGVDTDYLAGIGREMEDTATRLVGEIHDLAGEVFNINSGKQLGPILFEKLAIQEGTGKKPKKTPKTGAYATDVTSLESYAAHPIVAKIREYREVTKLKSTWVDAIPKLVSPATGRVHSTFHQAVAATGRLSSADPNMQNIPVRTEMGRRIRQAFVASPGHKLLAADYSQIELRLMAHLSGDPGMCEVYKKNGDIHAETASRMFGIPIDMVSRDQRSSAKAINFGILYGMGPQRLARDLKISFQDGREFLAAYFREFPGVKEFQNHAVSETREKGFVTTLLGRRRYIPELRGGGRGMRAQAENMAKNTPVQGTAADMIKVAMIRIHKRLCDGSYKTRMLLQVHDELVFEVPESPENELDRVTAMVKKEMAGALKLEVPIVVDVGVGDNWLEAH